MKRSSIILGFILITSILCSDAFSQFNYQVDYYEFEFEYSKNDFVEYEYSGSIILKPSKEIDWLVLAEDTSLKDKQIVYKKSNQIHIYRLDKGKWLSFVYSYKDWRRLNVFLDPTNIEYFLDEEVYDSKYKGFNELSPGLKCLKFKKDRMRKFQFDSSFFSLKDSIIYSKKASLNHAHVKLQESWKLKMIEKLDLTSLKLGNEVQQILSSGFLNSAEYSQSQPILKTEFDRYTSFKDLELYRLSTNDLLDTVRLDTFLNLDKPVLIDFWYVGCKPCYKFQKEFESYIDGTNLSDSFIVVRINMYDVNPEFIIKHLEKQNLLRNHIYEFYRGSLTLSAFNTLEFPYLVVIDKEGYVKYCESGFNPNTISQIINFLK